MEDTYNTGGEKGPPLRRWLVFQKGAGDKMSYELRHVSKGRKDDPCDHGLSRNPQRAYKTPYV